MSDQRPIKHPLPQRLVHWGNAAAFLTLWVTGIAIISNTGYRISPAFYVNFMNGLFGGPANLLHFHATLGVIWITILGVGFVVDPYGLSLRFLRDLKPGPNDLAWMKVRVSAELSGDTDSLPDQGAYNAGQKMFGVTAFGGILVIAFSGLAMWFASFDGEWARAMVLVHLIAVGGVVAFFFVHFAMAALLKEERPALKSMVHGDIDPDYAHHHHAEWVEAHGPEGEPLRADERFALPRLVGRAIKRVVLRIHNAPAKKLASPYLAGFGLGLAVLLGFVLLGHGPGSSGFFSRLGAMTFHRFAPDQVESNVYWARAIEEPLSHYWLTWTVAGIAVGGFISALLGRRFSFGIERGTLISARARLAMALGGGALVGIATRFSRGCTSHHLSEAALLSVGSWAFLGSVFIGGFTAAFFFRKVWR